MRLALPHNPRPCLPAGTGKTLLAKSIAAESGVRMFTCSGAGWSAWGHTLHASQPLQQPQAHPAHRYPTTLPLVPHQHAHTDSASWCPMHALQAPTFTTCTRAWAPAASARPLRS